MRLKEGGEIYKEDVEKVKELAKYLQQKWAYRTANLENLNEFASEATGRYLDLGYIVNVDITPALVGVGPPDVAIVRKIEIQEIDHDRLRKEAMDSFEEGR